MNELILVNRNLDALIEAWLHEKKNRTGSVKTERAYRDSIDDFRRHLASAGLDLDGPHTSVGLALQAFCARTAASGDGDGQGVSAATHNARLAYVSSFYRYGIKLGVFQHNPASLVQRRPVQSYANSRAIEPERVTEALRAIDRTTLQGKRDYALLLIALTTGRRLSEIANLAWGDCVGNGITHTLTFKAKGGKVMRDKLDISVSKSLYDYEAALCSKYGYEFAMPGSCGVWLSTSRNASNGNPLSVQALEQICEKHLGTTRFHALRHTFAHLMEALGAKTSDISARLGHSNIATTGIYLAQLASDENKFADGLARLIGAEG